jgi:hypothetical protein
LFFRKDYVEFLVAMHTDAVPISRKETIRAMLRNAVRSYLPDRDVLLVLFGSQASGPELKLADFDIGILGRAAIDPVLMTLIRGQIDELPMLYPVDNVDLRCVPDAFREFALQQGEQL